MIGIGLIALAVIVIFAPYFLACAAIARLFLKDR